MARRIHKSWTDYMIIGVSPALIIVMIWSLVAFLLTVLYSGPYPARITFIFAMFIMGAVLVTRISIEEGAEYASFFAVPLAIVMFIAAMRFVRYGDFATPNVMLINMGMIALIWWCGNRLTWDCTVIDDAEDASGEGLLQVMGIEGQEPESPAEAGAEPEPETPATPAPPQDLLAWWRDRVARRRRRKHTPGLWVIYVSLVALSLFGFLQRQIPATAAEARRSAFFLLCSFVACALGLLMTTSFLNLRRYLRQRRMQMPLDMAGTWLLTGAVLIVGMLIVSVVLPRPGAALPISQLPFRITSPDHSKPNQVAFGSEGIKSEQASKTSSQQQSGNAQGPGKKSDGGKPSKGKSGTPREGNQKQTGGQSRNAQSKSPSRQNSQSSQQKSRSSQAAGSKGNQSEQQPSSPTKSNRRQTGSKGNQRQTGNDSKQSSASRSPDGKTRQPKSGSTKTGNRKSSSPQPSGQQQPNQQNPDQTQKNRQNPGQTKSNQQPQGQTGKSRQNPAPTKSNQQDQDQTKSNQQDPNQTKSNQQNSGQKQSSQQSSSTDNSHRSVFSDGPKSAQQDAAKQREKSRSKSASSKSAGAPKKSPSFDPTKLISNATSALGTLVKVLFLLGLIGLVAFLAWKYRDTIRQALQQLIDDLKRLWQMLSGGGRRQPAVVEQAVVPQTPTYRPFASFRNPFADPAAAQWSTEQLVHYSFAAVEAWAIEHGQKRAEEQTPIEFAQILAGRFPGIGPETTRLADLYSRVAYGKQRISTRHRSTLERLWQQLSQA